MYDAERLFCSFSSSVGAPPLLLRLCFGVWVNSKIMYIKVQVRWRFAGRFVVRWKFVCIIYENATLARWLAFEIFILKSFAYSPASRASSIFHRRFGYNIRNGDCTRARCTPSKLGEAAEGLELLYYWCEAATMYENSIKWVKHFDVLFSIIRVLFSINLRLGVFFISNTTVLSSNYYYGWMWRCVQQRWWGGFSRIKL